jgi:hypothetical protein
MRQLVICVAASLAFALPAGATICTPDEAPAASLLIPYFAVSLSACTSTSGVRSDARIVNTANVAVPVAVTVWSNAGVPVRRDVHTLPAHGTLAVDLTAIACDPPTRNRLAGAADGLLCSALAPAFNDQKGAPVLEAYATVDVLLTGAGVPAIDDAAYFTAAWLSMANVLIGDVSVGARAFAAQSSTFAAVALEADASAFAPGDTTFYGRYNGADGSDAREPLPTAWYGRAEHGGVFGAEEFVIAWRETGPSLVPFACATGSPVIPIRDSNAWGLGRPFAYLNDGGEGVGFLFDSPFARATQRTTLVDRTIQILPESPRGELTMQFVGQFQHGATGYLDGGRHGQAWLAMGTTSIGTTEYGHTALPLDTSCTPASLPYAPLPRFEETP